ncbi:MAG: shikimate dehydrogenase [Anaerovoracaceae bacterium]
MSKSKINLGKSKISQEQHKTMIAQDQDKTTIAQDQRKTTMDQSMVYQFAVIGDPIEHSLSPVIHKPVLSQFYDHFNYSRVLIKKGRLEEWIYKVKKEKIKGFNITMPHKVDIIPFLDEIDYEAGIYNSVNTVVNEEGRLLGYNTDGRGFALALETRGYHFKDSNILILGAGGVAATLTLKAVIEKAKSVTLLARNPEKAEALIEQANNQSRDAENPTILQADRMEPEKLCKYAATADIVINATPLGMKGISSDFEDFRFLDNLHKDSLLCDLIYNPEKTTLLQEGESRGLRTMGGLDMLINQGILADELFINKKFDYQKMYDLVKEYLQHDAKERVEDL